MCKKSLIWTKNGTLEYLFEVLIKDTKLKKRMVIIDSSYIKVYIHATGAKIATQILVAQKGAQFESPLGHEYPSKIY